MNIDKAFNQTVAYYDDWIRKAVPGYDALFAAAGELIPFGPESAIDVLDLGAGTGLFSRMVLDKCPLARFALWDVAEKMLGLARERFRDYPDQFRYVVEDYRRLGTGESFDMVISSLSIHHLEDQEKRELFGVVYRVLRQGGIFINVDLVKGPTISLEEFYWTNWLEKIRRAGASEDEIRAGIERRKAFDRDATLENQLFWLREAGFPDADCVYRDFKIGVFFGIKR